MNKYLKFLILSILIFVSSAKTFSQERMTIAWLAARVGEKVITNYEVEEYINRVMLSDFSKSKLFVQAGKDLSKYKVLKRNYIYENNANIFKKALKKMVYGEMVKKHALQEFRLNASRNSGRRGLFGGRSNSAPVQRAAFNITERQFYDMLQETEHRMLKRFLDQKLGIVKARDLFGADLKKGNYPHAPEDSNTDIYFRWYRAMKNRLKQDMMDKEVKKWEAIQATKYNHDLYIRPMEVHDFYKRTSSYLQTHVLNQDMTIEKWTKILSDHPELSILMENTKILSLGGASLASIYKENPAKFKSLKEQIISSFSPQLNDALINKILGYEEKAQTLANKYSSAKELWDLHKKYDMKADDRSLMLSKLYKLAATIKEGKANRAETRKVLQSEFQRTIKLLKEKLKQDSFYLEKENEKFLFHMLVEASLKKESKELLETTDAYTKRAIYMGTWFTKFMASKVAFGTTITIKSNICSYNTYECQKKITDWLKMMEYNKGLEKFRTKTLQEYWKGMFTLNPVGQSTLHGQAAIDFIFN